MMAAQEDLDEDLKFDKNQEEKIELENMCFMVDIIFESKEIVLSVRIALKCAKWYLVSKCSRHITGDKALFKSLQ